MKLSNHRYSVYLLLLILTSLRLQPGHAQTVTYPKSVNITLPSALPSGNAVDDKILFTFYPAQSVTGQPTPAVILLHHLAAGNTYYEDEYAHYLTQRGIAAAVMTLPFHIGRRPKGASPLTYFIGDDVDVVVHSYAQAASDVSTVLTWLTQQPSIDPKRIGVAGVSLGAIVTHLAMGQDARISAGVALLGGGDFPDIFYHSLVGRLFIHRQVKTLTPAIEAKLRTVDPLTYANRNQPRRVFMVQAARDSFIPPRASEELWQALGRPPIQWIDTNHPGIMLAMHSAIRAATAYFEGVWSGNNVEGRNLPTIHAITIKTGFLIGLDSLVTPAVTWQAYSFATRHDHMSLLHADVGYSGRGPFAGLATTVNQFADVGVARRLRGNRFRPYASLHIVF